MLLKIINHSRKQARRPSDLRRLLRYLLTPQASLEGPTSRLLGPPFLSKLALSHMPWGAEVNAAAEQLTRQMIRYCRAARVGQPMPDVWYVHAIVSFSPAASPVLKTPVDPHQHVPRWASTAQNSYRIARDVLDFTGWTLNRPTVMVAHADRRHIHVHVVAVIPVWNDEDWGILRMSRRQLNEVAKLCAGAYGIPVASQNTDPHHIRWQHLLEVRPRV